MTYNFRDGDTVTGTYSGCLYTRKDGKWSSPIGEYLHDDEIIQEGLEGGGKFAFENYTIVSTADKPASEVQVGNEIELTLKFKVEHAHTGGTSGQTALSDSALAEDRNYIDISIPADTMVTIVDYKPEVFPAGSVVKGRVYDGYYTLLADNKYYSHQSKSVSHHTEGEFTSEHYERIA